MTSEKTLEQTLERTLDVVIPAGGVIDAAYADAIGSPFRALAPLGAEKTPVLQRIVDTLRASGKARRVICVAPPEVESRISGVDVWLTASSSGPENITRGLAAADPDAPALLCTSDLPLLTPDSVRDFVSHCRAEAQIALGLVRAEDYKAAFPDAPPSTFVHLRDAGPVTLAGVFQIHPALLARQEALFRRLFAARKDQWRMARLLGPRLLWQLATRSLRLTEITARAAALLQTPVQVVSGAAPVLAHDMDTLDDYTYAQARDSRTRCA